MTLGHEGLTPVFSGGTSLLKGHELIRRFSEDIDFKLGLSPTFLALTRSQRKARLSAFKAALCDAWEAAGFAIAEVIARDSNGFIQIRLEYPSQVGAHHALRPHILAELSAKPPRLPPLVRPLASFVHQYRKADPEIPSIGCVDPVETAADKLSAFAWRALERDRNQAQDDPAIVRHLYDLAALETVASAAPDFPRILHETLMADSGRGAAAALPPAKRLAAMLTLLDRDALYPDEYARFVEGMAFAGEQEIPTFAAARAAVARLCALAEDGPGLTGRPG